MNFRGIINFISENICPPNESRRWSFFSPQERGGGGEGEAECYFPKSVNRNSAGDLSPLKNIFQRGNDLED